MAQPKERLPIIDHPDHLAMLEGILYIYSVKHDLSLNKTLQIALKESGSLKEKANLLKASRSLKHRLALNIED